MAGLVWDAVGERRYETGVDRGVLYHPDNVAIAWNGLVSLTENLGREVKSYYIDGVKYLDYQVIGDYQATLKAFTYPDELNDLIGTALFAPGVYLHDQKSRAFSIAYRTMEEDDLGSGDYKLHLVYNVLATPSNADFLTKSDKTDLTPMEWTLNGTPPTADGIRPTSHITLHSRSIDSALLAQLELQLYGDESNAPYLQALPDLLTFIESYYAG